MSAYYYIATALPEVNLGTPPEMSFKNLVYLLGENLNKSDLEKTRTLRFYFDLENLRSLWRKEPIDLRGNYDENALEEAVAAGTELPNYVYDFVDKYDNINERLRHFPFLMSAYFQNEIPKADGFLKKYLEFERALRLVLVVLRARKFDRDLMVELQYENPDDPLIAQILSQKDNKSYDPPEEYQMVKTIFDELSDDPAALNKALAEYRIQKIDEMIGLKIFSIDYILAYLIKLIYLEKWLEQDSQKGLQIIKKIIEGAS